MRKEPIIAIIIGAAVGISVAFILWRQTTQNKGVENATQELSSQQNTTTQEENTQNSESKKDKTPANQEGFAVIRPADLSVVSQDTVEVAGIAPENSIVAIASQEEVALLSVDESGEFTGEVSLPSGYSKIQLWSIRQSEILNTEVSLVYDENVNNGSEEIKIAQMGSVTDISENAIQIKTIQDLIEQISVTSETETSSEVTDDDIEFSDIAIGDFIIALGESRKQNTLDAQRITVIEEPTDSKYTAIYGQIEVLSSSEFLVTDFSGSSHSIDATGGKVSVTSFDEENKIQRARLLEATEGERIIVIGEVDEETGELFASHIHIFAESQ